MKQLESKIIQIPTVYFITDREEIKELPVGVPFIYGDESVEKHIIRILEYEALYKKAKESGFPFDFKRLLKEQGYEGLQHFGYDNPPQLDYVTDEMLGDDYDIDLDRTEGEDPTLFNAFVKDIAAYVDIEVLKDLNVFPTWLDKIEDAVHTNIHNFAVFNENMYNKKLEGMYGSLDLVSPNKNLIIIDISGSIPKAVSSTCLTLAKNLAETFYADLLITGTISTLYPYEEIHSLDVKLMYDENGMNNDQTYFKALLTGDERSYKTAIVFGDGHSPCYSWQGSGTISKKDGQEMCKWTIDKLISFHTHSTKEIAGYADWFKPKEVEKIGNWVKYLE